jgi:hypothetical protein
MSQLRNFLDSDWPCGFASNALVFFLKETTRIEIGIFSCRAYYELGHSPVNDTISRILPKVLTFAMTENLIQQVVLRDDVLMLVSNRHQNLLHYFVTTFYPSYFLE